MDERDSTQVGKTCSNCQQRKCIEEFEKARGYKDGHRGQCRVCRIKLNTAYAKSKPKASPRKTDPAVTRRTKLKCLYGLTVDSFADLLRSQGGGCAICQSTSAGGRYGTFHVDHCHATGAVRGILCHNCNLTLGRLGDNLEAVLRFASYLQLEAQIQTTTCN